MLGNVFSFHGRRGRLSYLLTTLLLAVTGYIVIGTGYVFAQAGAPSGSINGPGTTILFFTGVILLLTGIGGAIWTSYAVAAQRLHDFGASGWWSLLNLVPFVGFVP